METAERSETEKPWNEAELIERLNRGDVTVPPVQLQLIAAEVKVATNTRIDGILEVNWQGQSSRFVFEYKALSTPKSLEVAMSQVLRYSTATGLRPMVILPYLSERSLRVLEAEQISGFDLCGNAIIVAPGLAVWRSGQPNRFRDSQPIRNVFRGNSSILARCFLLRPEFTTLVELRNFALQRLPDSEPDAQESRLTKGTVSKVVQALDEERIITRVQVRLPFTPGGAGSPVVGSPGIGTHSQERWRLTTPKVLMEKLKANYQKPRGKRVEGKMPLAITDAWTRLRENSLRAVVTGDGSAGRYRVLSGMEKLSLYVDDLEAAIRLLEVKPGRVFPNVELIEEASDLYYFDARREGDVLWASPIQTWLELSVSGPREREAAQVLETALLKGEADKLR